MLILQSETFREPEHNGTVMWSYTVPALPIYKRTPSLFLAWERPTALQRRHSAWLLTGRGRQNQETTDDNWRWRRRHSRQKSSPASGLRRSRRCADEPSAEPVAGLTSRRCQAPTRCLATRNQADQAGTALKRRWRHPWQPKHLHRRVVSASKFRWRIHHRISRPKQWFPQRVK